MKGLDPQTQASRMVGEILNTLRSFVRDTLRQHFANDWVEKGIPSDIRDFLGQRQVREASINWNQTDTLDQLDYAGFANLHDVITANPELATRFTAVAADPSVLRIRFLELETVLNRLAYARPISDSDVTTLSTFSERLNKTLGITTRSAAVTQPPRIEVEASTPEPAPAPPMPATSRKSQDRAAPARTVAPAMESAPTPAKPDAGALRVSAKASTSDSSPNITEAIAASDHKAILTALYYEVTGLADRLWNGSVAGVTFNVWDKVRESTWYSDNFSNLGLKSVSDFYDLVATARDRMTSGGSRGEIQDLLKDHNFSQLLLNLRDLFRRNLTP